MNFALFLKAYLAISREKKSENCLFSVQNYHHEYNFITLGLFSNYLDCSVHKGHRVEQSRPGLMTGVVQYILGDISIDSLKQVNILHRVVH